MSPHRPVLVLLLLLTATACDKKVELTVTAGSANLREAPSSGARVVGTLPAGKHLVGRIPRFGAEPDFYRQEGTTPPVYVSRQEVAPFPLRGRQSFVVVPSTVRFAGPTPSSTTRGRLSIGEAVEVLEQPAAGPFVPTLEAGDVSGFVERAHLSPTPPTAAQLLEAALQALRRQSFPEATRLAEGVLKLEKAGEHRTAALELATALLLGTDWERSQAYRKELGTRAPWPQLAPEQPPAEGAPAYVVASLLKLRTAPRANARRLADLPILTPVRVKKLQGEWAQVEMRVPQEAIWDLGDGSGEPRLLSRRAEGEAAKDERLSGFVSARFLDQVPPTLEKLRDAARAAHEAGRLDEAVLHLQRARAAAEPSQERALAQELFEASLAARRYEAAVQAMKEAVSAPRDERSPEDLRADLQLVWGCRGDLSRAVVLAEGSPLEEDACLSNVDTIPPCIVVDLHDEDDSGEDERRQRAEQGDFWKDLERRTQDYYAPSRLRITLEHGGPTRPSLEGLFLYSYQLQLEGYCENYTRAEKTSIQVTPLRLTLGEDDERTVAWLEVPEYTGSVHGLIQAESAEQARESVRWLPIPIVGDPSLPPPEEPAPEDRAFPLVETHGPIPECFDCGC